MINYKAFSKHFPKPSCENATQTSLIKVLLLKGVWISRLKACPLMKQGCSKRIYIERQTPTKTLIIHFHLSTKNDWQSHQTIYCKQYLMLSGNSVKKRLMP